MALGASSALFISEKSQLSDIIFQVERSRRYVEQIRNVCIRGRLGESKEFALYINEFLKECINLRALMIIRTNLGGLMLNSKNMNLFRDLKTT